MKIILTVLFALGIIAAIASSNNSSTEKPTSSVSCEKEVDNITDSQSNEAETETESTVAGNLQSSASSTKKYVDKQNIQDLSDAKAGMENSTNYAILVVGARLGFLTASGFSDEEAMQIIAPESEDTTG